MSNCVYLLVSGLADFPMQPTVGHLSQELLQEIDTMLPFLASLHTLAALALYGSTRRAQLWSTEHAVHEPDGVAAEAIVAELAIWLCLLPCAQASRTSDHSSCG